MDTETTQLTTSDEVGFLVTYFVMPDKWTDNTYAPPLPNESPIYFGCSAGSGEKAHKVYGVQVRKLTSLFRDGSLKSSLPTGMCLLFLIIDVREDMPLGYAKLYKEGFFTARSTEKETIFRIENVKFVFDSYILRTDPIPTNVSYSQNRLLLAEPVSRKFF